MEMTGKKEEGDKGKGEEGGTAGQFEGWNPMMMAGSSPAGRQADAISVSKHLACLL